MRVPDFDIGAFLHWLESLGPIGGMENWRIYFANSIWEDQLVVLSERFSLSVLLKIADPHNILSSSGGSFIGVNGRLQTCIRSFFVGGFLYRCGC
jgi:hypothetical protein